MAAKRSSVVRARDGVGVTMVSSEPPLVVGAGDDSAALESNTSPEKEALKLHKPADGTVSAPIPLTQIPSTLPPTHTLLT